MDDVVVAAACRTAIGAFGGTLKDVPPYLLAATVIREALGRAGVDPGAVDDVRLGCCFEPYQTKSVARSAAIEAGIPTSVTAVSMDRVCVSAMEAVVSGMAMIKAGLADVIVAGGVEVMSGVPYAVPSARWGARLQNQTIDDQVIEGLYCGSRYHPCPPGEPGREGPVRARMQGQPYVMGHTAELLAEEYAITREAMDELALRSHHNVERATNNGDFADEIVPVEVPQRKGRPPVVFARDEHFRPGLTMEDLAALPAAFVPGVGKVTAGNSSGINDGASAMVLLSADKARELGVTPLARLKAVGYGGCEPSLMGISPVPAVRDLERRSGLRLGEFELLEVHEAFASQYLACEMELGFDREITNVNGSGIGLGHPVGSTGCRLMVTLLHAMRSRDKTLGLATLCGGGGVSMAVALEAL
ncbi:MAG TPA: acetyl-CoA C-acyltransferase [Thermoleophilia bacterium]|nr:acetyl-CoA C-acyltransferase [Thermoleophilia bacterium]